MVHIHLCKHPPKTLDGFSPVCVCERIGPRTLEVNALVSALSRSLEVTALLSGSINMSCLNLLFWGITEQAMCGLRSGQVSLASTYLSRDRKGAVESCRGRTLSRGNV